MAVEPETWDYGRRRLYDLVDEYKVCESGPLRAVHLSGLHKIPMRILHTHPGNSCWKFWKGRIHDAPKSTQTELDMGD